MKKKDIIICASLLEKVPNFGHLTRTSEIFGVSALTIPNKSLLDDEEYKKEAIKRVERYLKNTWKTINKKPTMDLGEWKLFCAINCYDGGDDYLVYLKLSEIEKSEYVKAIEVSD